MNALVLLGVAGAAAFALTTAAVSATGPVVAPSSEESPYPFSNLSLTGGVQAPGGSSKSYTIDFVTTFTLHPDSPGITQATDEHVIKATTAGTLADVTIENSVAYPVPGGYPEQAVGPVGLPFATQTLALTVRLRGHCFTPQTNDDGWREYVLAGDPYDCAAATLTLGDRSYDVSSLFESLDATIRQVGSRTWRATFTGAFANPGYTFPVSSLGGDGDTSLRVGPNGGVAPTVTAAFGGGPHLVGPPTDANQCRGSGWKVFNNPSFKNQGDCVSFVATGGKNVGAG